MPFHTSHTSVAFAPIQTTAQFNPLTTTLNLFDPYRKTMTETLEITAGDTHEPVRARLFDPDDDPADLESGNDRVTFLMTDRSGEAVVDAPAEVEAPEVTDGEQGWVRYEWRRGQTDAPGLYTIRFRVRYADGTRMHYPNARPAKIYIRGE